MPRKYTALIIICLMIVLLSMLSAYLYCLNKLELVDVYSAKYNLSMRTLINEDLLEINKYPKAYLNEEIIVNKEDIINKYVKIDSSIPKGSFFYKSAIEDLIDAKDSVNAYLKEGEVAYDVYLKDIKANQAYLSKGVFVDLYLTINKDRVLSDLLINNLKIIGLYDINHNEIKQYDEKTILDSICLAVPKEIVSYLNKANVVGELRIVLGENSYQDIKSKLNENSEIFAYLK